MKSIYVDNDGNEWQNGGTYTDASLVTMADGTTVQADVSALQTDNTQNKTDITNIKNQYAKNSEIIFSGGTNYPLTVGSSITLPLSKSRNTFKFIVVVLDGSASAKSDSFILCSGLANEYKLGYLGGGVGYYYLVQSVYKNQNEISLYTHEKTVSDTIYVARIIGVY